MGERLKLFGKMTSAVLKNIMAPQVGHTDMCDAIGYIENAGAPTSVVPDFIGQKLFDTSGSDWYVAFGTASGEWAPMGLNTLSATELGFLDGALVTNVTASKVAVIGADGILKLPTALHNTAGAGITGGTGTIFKTSVTREGGIVTTKILIDLTGAASSTTDLDIIGQGASVAHIGQITAAVNGTILGLRMTCLEVPAGGADDIDLYAATEGTGVFDGAIGDLAETALITAGGAWTVGLTKAAAADVAANKYLYLCGGEAGTAATYTAGRFLIEINGYDA